MSERSPDTSPESKAERFDSSRDAPRDGGNVIKEVTTEVIISTTEVYCKVLQQGETTQ